MNLHFEVTIIEDVHKLKTSQRLLQELADDIASAVCAHSRVEGNAVSCKPMRAEELLNPRTRKGKGNENANTE